MSSNTPFANSIQPFAIAMGSSATTGTATLSPAVGSGAFVLFNGLNSSDSSGTYKYSDASVTLTNSTTVTATRFASGSTTDTIYGVVIDATPALVSSVQFGTVAIGSGNSTGTATITSVNTSTSAVFFLGSNDSTTDAGSPKTTQPYVTLTNSTTVTANLAASNATGVNVSFCVVTFNSAVIKSLQQFTTTSTTSTTTDTQTITSVVPTNAIVAYGGTNSNSTSPASAYFYANLASATSLNFVTNTATTTSRTHAATVIEFIAGIVNVQRGTLPIVSSSNSITSTITSVDTTASALNFTGANTNQTTFTGAYCNASAVLTNSTTVTGQIGAVGPADTAGFEVISLKGGTIYETGNGVDTISASANFVSGITESGSAADSTSSSAHFVTSISESGSASDTFSVGASIWVGNIVEAGNASDTVSGGKLASASIVETGSASDSISEGYAEGGVVGESGNAMDSADAEQLFGIPVVGSQGDMLWRLLTNLPSRWFPAASDAVPPLQAAPTLAGILSGAAAAFSWMYGQIQYVGQQMRIQTASGFNLDLISMDYFGVGGLPRRPGENDNPFRTRILQNLLLPRGTRQSVFHALKTLTGVAPKIFEPLNPHDTGGYAPAGSTKWYGLAYGYAGGYGSFAYPYQMFITAQGTQASVNPVANVNGYCGYLSGYGTPGNISPGNNSEYASGVLNTGSISDADIYAAVAENMPAGTVGWVGIET